MLRLTGGKRITRRAGCSWHPPPNHALHSTVVHFAPGFGGRRANVARMRIEERDHSKLRTRFQL
jgi:hypothetical protein